MDNGQRHDRFQAGPGQHAYGINSAPGQLPASSYGRDTYASTSRAPRYGHHSEASIYEEPFDINAIDPALRLRTTRTAHSVIAESIRSEDVRVQRKRSRLFHGIKRMGTRRRLKEKEESGHDDRADLPNIPASDTSDASPDTRPASLATATEPAAAAPVEEGGKKKQPLPRRSIFVNTPLPMSEVDGKGEPRVRYVRNKVRTSKYTLVTFLPRNLYEQFKRVANIYFLGLVILQLFPMFGATTPQIAMLPLVAILGMTAIKDAVEDWRRARLDEEVNTSAATKLGNWKNVNQPTDPRNWFERIFHLGPGKRRSERY